MSVVFSCILLWYMKLTSFDQRERNPNLIAGLPIVTAKEPE